MTETNCNLSEDWLDETADLRRNSNLHPKAFLTDLQRADEIAATREERVSDAVDDAFPVSEMDKDIETLKAFVAIPNDLETCQTQLIEARNYIDGALRAVELHRRHKVIPSDVSKECPYLSKMLNEDLSATVGINEEINH